MKKLLVISVLAMAIMAPIAQAGHKGHKVKRGAFYDEAEVVNVEAITRTVRISVPERECWEEEVYYSDAPIHDKRLEEVSVGGLHLEVMGLTWLLFGIILATASREIASIITIAFG